MITIIIIKLGTANSDYISDFSFNDWFKSVLAIDFSINELIIRMIIIITVIY